MKKKTSLFTTIIIGSRPYGIDPNRKVTQLMRLKAILWLKYWDIRMWLVDRGLFVQKVIYYTSGDKK